MIVVKIGGSIGLEKLEPVLRDVAALKGEGETLILVHGGGRMVTGLAEKLGLSQRFYRGPSGFTTRYTDMETIRLFEMVMAGLYNKEIVSTLLRMNVKAVGISGIDGSLVVGERKRRILVVDDEGRKRYLPGDYSGRPV